MVSALQSTWQQTETLVVRQPGHAVGRCHERRDGNCERKAAEHAAQATWSWPGQGPHKVVRTHTESKVSSLPSPVGGDESLESCFQKERSLAANERDWVAVELIPEIANRAKCLALLRQISPWNTRSDYTALNGV
jgi:hypothetical protein